MRLKGYVSVRLPVPVSVQNLVLRDYCQRHGHTYLLADVEYVMEGSYVMLRGIDAPAIVAYSMFMAPEHEWPKGKEIHFALENYVWPRDAKMLDTIWRLKSLLRS